MKKERGDVGGVSLRMKREDGVLVSSKEEMKGELKRHFESSSIINGGVRADCCWKGVKKD